MSGWILRRALSIVRGLLKNPSKKLKLRAVLLEIRDAITAVFDRD